ASQFIKSKAFASDCQRSLNESVGVGCFAGIESKALFVQISEKMKRFYRNISTFDAPFQKRPKVFDAVGMNAPANIGLGVVYKLMKVFAAQAGVSGIRIGHKFRSGFNVLSNFALNSCGLRIADNFGSHFAVTLKHSHDDNLAFVSGFA